MRRTRVKRRGRRGSLSGPAAASARAPVTRNSPSRPKRADADVSSRLAPPAFSDSEKPTARWVVNRKKITPIASAGQSRKTDNCDFRSFDRANIGSASVRPPPQLDPHQLVTRAVRSEARATRAFRRDADSTVDRAPRIAGKGTAARRTQPRDARRALFAGASAMTPARMSRGKALLALAALCAALVSVQGASGTGRLPRARARARSPRDRSARTRVPRLFFPHYYRAPMPPSKRAADTTLPPRSRLRLPHQLRVVRRRHHLRMVRSRPDPIASARSPRPTAAPRADPRVVGSRRTFSAPFSNSAPLPASSLVGSRLSLDGVFPTKKKPNRSIRVRDRVARRASRSSFHRKHL